MNWFDWTSLIGSISSTLSLLVLIPGGMIWLFRNSYTEVRLSCGSFKIKRKLMNRADLTSVVSLVFFNGGNVPDGVRKEIVVLTGIKSGADYNHVQLSSSTRKRKGKRKE